MTASTVPDPSTEDRPHPPTHPSTPTPPGPRRRWPAVLGVLAVLGTVGWLLSAYVPPDMATSRVDVHGDQVRYLLLLVHIGTAAVATVTGPAALWSRLRRRFPAVHRWIGRTYFVLGVFPSALVAVPVALWSQSGLSNMAGLLTLAGLWAGTGVAGLRAARQRRFADHRTWMLRNYAVTLAGIASRPWGVIVALVIVPMSDGPIYHGDGALVLHDIASAGVWLGIVGNLVIAELLLRRRARPRRRAHA